MEHIAIEDLHAKCSYAMRHPAVALSDCCQRHATSAVEDPHTGAYYYRCLEHKGRLRGSLRGVVITHLTGERSVGRITKTEMHRYEHHGDNTVLVAAQLIGKLPNGWTLKSFEHQGEYGPNSWVAIVEGPAEDMST